MVELSFVETGLRPLEYLDGMQQDLYEGNLNKKTVEGEFSFDM